MGPVRASNEPSSAYRLRCAAYSAKWLAVLGIGLAGILLVRPWSDAPAAMFVVFFLYIGLGLGFGTALLATGGFLVGSFWARTLERSPGTQRRWTGVKKGVYATLVLVVVVMGYGAALSGVLSGETLSLSRNGVVVQFAERPLWFLVSMAFWLWVCIAGPRYALRVVREALAA